jgi:CheY-like chemotaxis protein
VLLPLERRPWSAAPDAPAARVAMPPSPAPALRVLAAEDNAMNQVVLKTLLGAVGIEPTFVADGREAVQAWRSGDWDLVLMDVQMPVMDGLEAVAEIRAAERREGRRHTPIVALTANAMAHHRRQYLSAGMDGVVAKPIELGVLLQEMDAAIASVDAPPWTGRMRAEPRAEPPPTAREA